ncbi:glycoside hydrolase 5 family protein [Aspergillus foveolatus]|uniref:glycoside hydrolase 5 family protein n=1 Tax=Aspergillus foveolatus TaxID=210207 RepID=UPI003CCE4647
MKHLLSLICTLGAATLAAPAAAEAGSMPSLIRRFERLLAFLPHEHADVGLALDHFAESALKILRVWGFSDVNAEPSDNKVYFQLHQNGASTSNMGPNGLERLDYIVSAAERRGIKLIIPFVNYWDDFGGMNAYISAYGGDKPGWYTNAKIQASYHAYIKAVVSRYVDSPAIFAWELANEHRCSGCNTSIIHQWATKTSGFIKTLDPHNMVAIGDEGMGLSGDSNYPYSHYEGNDFALNLAIPDIDFGTLHLYTTDWGVSNNSWGNKWVQDHAAVCESVGKPCLFEENGMKDNHCTDELAWQKTALASPGMAADLFWHFGDNLSSGQTHNDRYTVYYGSDDWKCVVTDQVAAIGCA